MKSDVGVRLNADDSRVKPDVRHVSAPVVTPSSGYNSDTDYISSKQVHVYDEASSSFTVEAQNWAFEQNWR